MGKTNNFPTNQIRKKTGDILMGCIAGQMRVNRVDKKMLVEKTMFSKTTFDRRENDPLEFSIRELLWICDALNISFIDLLRVMITEIYKAEKRNWK